MSTPDFCAIQGAIDHVKSTALTEYRKLVAEREELRRENVALTAQLDVALNQLYTANLKAAGTQPCG